MKITKIIRLAIALIFCIGLFPIVKAQNAAAKKEITLEDIWQRGKFAEKRVPSFRFTPDGAHYTTLASAGSTKMIMKNSIATGQAVETLFTTEGSKLSSFAAYELSADGKWIVLTLEEESIYRRSTKGKYLLYNISDKSITKISNGDGYISYPTINSAGTFIAFTRDNNLFIQNLKTGQETAITTDGEKNKIINGSTDWVYEEEFGFAQAFFWNADGSQIAYYRFDETAVKEFNMQYFEGLYPTDYRFKYPKAGEDNSKVSIHIYDVASKKKQDFNTGKSEPAFEYIPRIKWTNIPSYLMIYKMNRYQNKLELALASLENATTKSILEEEDKAYIDITDNLTFLPNSQGFIWTSERDGLNTIYRYGLNGNLQKKYSTGIEVDNIVGVNLDENLLYFTSPGNRPETRQLYSLNLKNGKHNLLTNTSYAYHDIKMGPNAQFYVDVASSMNKVPVTTLFDKKGKALRVLEENKALEKAVNEDFVLGKTEFFNFKTSTGVTLHGYMIKPADFNPNKKYPVLSYVYGGPGHQNVLDMYNGFNHKWYNLLANKGYIIVSVDNRGTGGKGAAFKKATYRQLGKLEVEDQIEVAKYLQGLPYVEGSRIGVWGWSFGGYLTSLCLTKGADYFKTGIAVAPVTNWRYYDNIYTERYLGLPNENTSGYDDNSPVNHASKLKGNFLLIHGTADDNVHFQNAVMLQKALIEANKQFTSFYYPNKDHGIYGGITRYHLYKMMTDYLLKNL